MAWGLKKHLKRLNAPWHWMLDKLGSAFAPKPSLGPHKERECLPFVVLLRNKLKYALTYCEVVAIVMQCLISIDGKVHTEKCYPIGFMDMISIAKTNENFCLLYDNKGRFTLYHISTKEAKYKLCMVRATQFGDKGVLHITAFNSHTIRYLDPLIKAKNIVKINLETGKVVQFIKFNIGNIVMVTRGHNKRHIGVIQHYEKHKGSFDIIHVIDATGQQFATHLGNEFTIEQGAKPWVTLPCSKGIKLFIVEEAKKQTQALKAAA